MFLRRRHDRHLQNISENLHPKPVLGSAAVRLTHFTAFSEAESTTQMRISQPAPMGESQLVSVDTRTIVRLYPAKEGEQPDTPEEKPADPEDAKVITDPGKQKLKWYTP